ncbi:Hint domain-containing protein [Phaeovulum sp. NW3]|uniref:Hint domain-containing protein n=1 Tax=Phaeovulum sp. NW3 TaxID=2934933 RepID=UPI0020203702|nr:Hint domain-containing protein [Phaeovulum sp. NW3]MCL7464264.1 Hint domain-containing protein [Phaeovulum sp. NW3]
MAMEGMAEGGWIAAHVPGEGALTLDARPFPALAGRGTLLLEFTTGADFAGPIRLIHLATRTPEPRLLSLAITPERRIEVIQLQGAAFHALSIDASTELATGGRMRLSWRWDTADRQSLLTLEALDTGTLRQNAGADPLPLPRIDLEALTNRTGAARIGLQVDWLALGDHLQPVGPAGCFAPATQIETPQGPRPANLIRAGDLVETVDAGAQPVLWSGRVSLPALGALRPVRLCAPVYGRTRDLWLLPQHRIAVAGPAVQGLFASEEVLVESRHLVDGRGALQPDRAATLTWQGILLQDHHLLIADGCRIESLGLGRLARSTALAMTTALADLAAKGRLPVHDTPARPILSDHDARRLATARDRGSRAA